MTLRVSLRNLRIVREKGGSRFELRVPSLDVHAGECLAVLGGSGCGKSTLLDVLALALRPEEAGCFRLYAGNDGVQDVPALSAAGLARLRGRHMGYVLQSGGLLSFLSVRDNIALPGRLQGVDAATLEKRIAWLASQLGIDEQLDKKPQHLSGGQRQRAAIARALVHAPLMVLADEPTAAVDQRNAGAICQVFKKIVCAGGAALVLVSHDVQLAKSFADRTVGFDVQNVSPRHVVSTVIPEQTDGRRL